MAEGYVSDVPGDDTVMDEPEVVVRVDVSQLPPEQALAITQQNDFADQSPDKDWVIGALMNGEDVTENLNPVEFHLPISAALTALSSIGVVDVPENPSELDQQD